MSDADNINLAARQLLDRMHYARLEHLRSEIGNLITALGGTPQYSMTSSEQMTLVLLLLVIRLTNPTPIDSIVYGSRSGSDPNRMRNS